jgi:hypothetical protein
VSATLLLLGMLLAQAIDVASVKRSAPDNPDGSMFDYGNGRLAPQTARSADSSKATTSATSR